MATVSIAARLLVVDDEPMICDMLCAFLADQGYVCESCGGVDRAMEILAAGGIDLVISDLHMPGRTGLELLQAVGVQYPQVAFLMATSAPDTRTAIEAMRHGASDFLIKPLELSRVLASVRQALDRQRQRAKAEARRREMERLLAEQNQQLGAALAMALDVRARDVAGHSQRVSRYTVELASRMGYTTEELKRIEYASYLHDVGKLGIPDAILNKPGSLTPEELEIMRSHVRIGFDLVNQVQSLAPAADLVLAHQEHYDGNGYPRGLAGEDIPRDARIFAVADALDAMTSNRPYRRALSWEEASEEIRRQSGRQFDPAVVEAFVQVPIERWTELQSQPT